MNSILIKNGHLLDSENGVDSPSDVFIREGKVVAIGEEVTPFLQEAHEVVDASGKLVIPGLIDMCVSLREPGYKQKGTLRTELHAAVKGGVTSVCSHPMSRPVNDAEAITRLILDKAEDEAKARVFPVAVATKGAEGAQLSEYQGLQKAGCIAVCHNRRTKVSSPVLRRSFQYASTHNTLVIVEPEDPELSQDGCVNEGILSARLGLVGIPEIAETLPLSRALMLAEETGVRLHIAQISSARAVELISEAKQRGVPVTCDVAIHHLMLTEQEIEDFNPQFHLRPPLRTPSDRAALLQGVNDGTIDAIVSQHLPHETAAKQAPFAEAEAGASTVEWLLSLVWKLVQDGLLEKGRALAALTHGPATIIGIAKYGLRKGAAADLLVFDPTQTNDVNQRSFASLGSNSPYIGSLLPGKVVTTLVAGDVVYTLESEDRR